MEGKSIKKTINTLLVIFSLAIITLVAGYFVFQSSIVQTVIISSLTKRISRETNTHVSIGRVDIAWFRKVILEDVYLSDQQKDTLFYSPRLLANIDTLSFAQRKIHFKSITFDRPQVNIKATDSTGYNFKFILDLLNESQPSTQNLWRYKCNRFELNKGELKFDDPTLEPTINQLLNIDQFNLILDDFKLFGQYQLSVNVEKLKFKSKNGFEMKDLSTHISYSDSTFYAAQLLGNTKYSQLQVDSLELKMNTFLHSGKLVDLGIFLDIKNIDFGMRDLACFLGTDFDKDLHSKLSGIIQGDIFNFRGKNFKLSIENFTHLNGDFYINGLSDINSAYIFLNLNESYANLNEIRNLDLPTRIQLAINQLPAFLENVGTFSYKGNFTGFIDDFVAYGTAYSNLGIITSDISLKPLENEKIKINGHLITDNLDIGTIFRNSNFDKLSLTGVLKGTIDYHSNFDLTFDGMVDSIDFNNYRYHMIELTGLLQNNKFNGNFSISDPNLHMNYSGKLDLSTELPIFEFVANIEHANLYNLHLIKDKNATLKLDVDANFEGNNIDNVKGNLALSDVYYRNEIDELFVKELILNNSTRNNQSVFTINSDVLDGKLVGQYNLMNIGKSLVSFYQQYLPSSSHSKIEETEALNEYNDFEYHFHFKDLISVTKVFASELLIAPHFDIIGYYKPLYDSVFAESNLPFIQYSKHRFENVKMVLNANHDRIHARVKSDKISINEIINLYNITIDSEGKNDQLEVNVFWNNYGENTFSGKLKTLTTFKRTESAYPSISLKIEPSNLFFSDSLWVLDETIIQIDSSSVNITDLNFHHNDQRFQVNGKISKNSSDIIYAKIENVDLMLFEPLMGASYFSGRVNGNASLADAYEKTKLNLNLSINQLAYDGGDLGDLSLSSKWNNSKDHLDSDISLVKDNKTIFEATGAIDPLNNQLDMNLLFDKSPVSVLQVFLPSSFNNQQGLVDGKIHLHGKFLHILHDGILTPVNEAGIGLGYLNTTYFFSDPIRFSNDSILFKKIRFKDEKGNTGIFNGSIKHQTFNKMVYDMNVESNKLLVLNTTSADNNYFYGTAYVSGSLDITGSGSTILLSGDAKSEKGTNVFIPYESGEDAEQYDFIEFINHQIEKKEETQYNVVTTGLDMNFDLEVTPDAKVQIIFNSQIGDVIKGTGNGNLQIRVDRNYNITMYGNYVIEEGDYLFTLQNVINKRFSIENGSTMEWVGDPYDAIINIKSVYKVKTSLYDLFVGGYQDFDLSRRIPVDCVINLTENLMTPKIDFAIELPTVEERIKDEVSQLIVTKEDINKQIISLLMLGRFYTPEFFAGKPTSQTSADLVGTTASELFSNQLSNWLSKIHDDLNVGIKWRPGNEISNDQIELALSTQILNDRITIDGNIANNANPNSTNGEVVGDFDLNIKLTDNGKLQFKAYNHTNDNIIYATAPYTWGVGFSYREEFNSINELPVRFKEFITRKFKKKGKNEKLKNE